MSFFGQRFGGLWPPPGIRNWSNNVSDQSSELHRRASELFLAAADLPAAGRERFLNEACRGDAALRAEVDALLRHDGDEDEFLATPAIPGGFTAKVAADAMSPRGETVKQIGQFRILGVLGEGGMGTVYRAEQDHPRRIVALKVLRADRISAAMLQRFEHEAKALGRLHHHGIAQIYEAGTFETESGVHPYFAMELVDGLPLSDFIAARDPDVASRVGILIRICEAVDHAHRRGVVHRDLKPANIIVTEGEASSSGSSSGFTGSGGAQPTILDFGIARITDSDRQATTIHTDVGQLLGTLAYMSPEQVAAEPDTIDARSDVYAIGVIAYEMLAGRPPLEIRDKALHEAVRIIRDEDPKPLSSVNRMFRGDLETILAKAMEKERSRRYESAAAFADDLQRYLRDEPVSARRPSTLYQIAKFTRRHRALVVGSGIVFMALVAGIIGTGIGFARAVESGKLAEERAEQSQLAGEAERTQRELAERRERDLQRVGDFQAMLLYELNPQEMGAEIVQDLRDQMEASLAPDPDTGFEAEDLQQFTRMLDRVNPANLGRHVIDRTMLERAAAAIKREFAEDPAIEASLRQTLAGAYFQLGMFDRGEPHLRRAHEIWHDLHGPGDHRTLHALRFISVILRQTGRMREAEEVAREVVTIAEASLHADDPEWFEALNQLALTLDELNRVEEAETYYRRAMDGRIRVLGERHPETLSSLHNFAGVLGALGRTAEAEESFRRALEGRREVLGPDDPATLTTLSQYAVFLSKERRFKEAEPVARSAYEARRRVLGDAHPQTVSALNALGHVLLGMDRLEDAEPVLRRSHAGRADALGAAHPETLNSLHNLISLLRRMERFDEVRSLLPDAVEVVHEVFPASHPARWRFLQQLALMHAALKEMDEATHAWQRTLAAAHEAHGPDHPASLRVEFKLAAHLHETEHHAAALPHAERAASGLLLHMGADHAETKDAEELVQSIRSALGPEDVTAGDRAG